MLGPHMKRITLRGEALSDIPEDQESGYSIVKRKTKKKSFSS